MFMRAQTPFILKAVSVLFVREHKMSRVALSRKLKEEDPLEGEEEGENSSSRLQRVEDANTSISVFD